MQRVAELSILIRLANSIHNTHDRYSNNDASTGSGKV